MPLLDRCLQILVHVRRKDACISHFFMKTFQLNLSQASRNVLSRPMLYICFLACLNGSRVY